jgi:outer membrane lipoprotein-sorting protein
VISTVFAVLAAASGLGPVGASQDSQPVERPVVTGPGIAEVDLETALERFDRAQRETTTMVARFTERKELKLLAEPLVSRGEFFFNRPNQVRWEYTDPEHKVFVITENKYVAYYPAAKRAEEVKIKKFVGKRMFRFLGVGQSIDDLAKYYDFQLGEDNDLESTHLLILTPRKKRIRESVAVMKIWVDAETFLPRQVSFEEADGDTTLLSFHQLRVNIEVADRRFRIDLPPDVVVSETFNGFSLGHQSF